MKSVYLKPEIRLLPIAQQLMDTASMYHFTTDEKTDLNGAFETNQTEGNLSNGAYSVWDDDFED